jgi:outer membrane protein TolC
MKVGNKFVKISSGILLACAQLLPQGQGPATVSLAQAQQIALQNHPRIASAELAAQASGFVVKQVRSAYFPTLSGNVTGVGTEHGSVRRAL